MTPTSATLSGSLFLRSLQLLGFKTFARQTEILFDGGVTAIVGPNGSGKTNIVDSIKWVLGSGQARDLRGKKMEEVIYAGGERRNRASFAEVTMVFDNSAGRLPVDYHEVAIKRRIERGGETLMHDRRIVALDEMRIVPVSAHELGQLLAADASQHRRIGDLETVEMKDRKNRAIARRVQKFVGVPTGGQRTSFRLAVADDAGDDQIRIVEGGAIGMSQ